MLQKIAFYIILLLSYSNYALSLEVTEYEYSDALGKSTINEQDTMSVEETSPWEFGIAVGQGKKDNILTNSKDTNINAFLHIAYFGDNFFFDNGDFGYYLTNNDNWNFSVIASPNSEREFFKNLDNFGLSSGEGSAPIDTPSEIDPLTYIQHVKPADRDKTIDIGIELVGDGLWGELQLQVNTELSNKHNGFEIWSGYSYKFNIGKLNIVPSFGATFKSKKWTNYFYGVKENESISSSDGSYLRAPYRPTSSLNSFYKLTMHYPLTENLTAVAVFENEALGKAIKESPIVDNVNKTTQFIGVYYEF